MKRKELTSWAIVLFGLGLLFVEGGWPRMVAIVTVFVVVLVGGIVWIAERIGRNVDSN